MPWTYQPVIGNDLSAGTRRRASHKTALHEGQVLEVRIADSFAQSSKHFTGKQCSQAAQTFYVLRHCHNIEPGTETVSLTFSLG